MTNLQQASTALLHKGGPDPFPAALQVCRLEYEVQFMP